MLVQPPVPAPRLDGLLGESAGHAVIATDAAGTVLHWNAAAEQLYGWPAAEAIGRSVLDLTPSAGSAEQADEIMLALRSGMSWTGEFRVRRRDGSEFTALITNRPLLDADGEVVGVLGTSCAVTTPVETAPHLESAVAAVSDAVLTTGPDGTVLTWNPAAEALLGWRAAEVVGRPSSLVGHDRPLPPSGAVVQEPARLRHRDGSAVPVVLTVTAVLDRGRCVGTSVVFRAAVGAAGPGAASQPARRRTVRTPGPEHGLLRLRELHAQGASPATIAAALNAEGFVSPTGHRWHGKAVARVLSGPA